MDNVYASLRAQPLPAYANESYSIITETLLRNTVNSYLYMPPLRFPLIASMFASLEDGDASALSQLFTGQVLFNSPNSRVSVIY